MMITKGMSSSQRMTLLGMGFYFITKTFNFTSFVNLITNLKSKL